MRLSISSTYHSAIDWLRVAKMVCRAGVEEDECEDEASTASTIPSEKPLPEPPEMTRTKSKRARSLPADAARPP